MSVQVISGVYNHKRFDVTGCTVSALLDKLEAEKVNTPSRDRMLVFVSRKTHRTTTEEHEVGLDYTIKDGDGIEFVFKHGNGTK